MKLISKRKDGMKLYLTSDDEYLETKMDLSITELSYEAFVGLHKLGKIQPFMYPEGLGMWVNDKVTKKELEGLRKVIDPMMIELWTKGKIELQTY